MLSQLPKSHISYSGTFEMMKAARHAGVDWITFVELSGQDKADIIVGFRGEGIIQALEAKEQADEANRRNNKGQGQ